MKAPNRESFEEIPRWFEKQLAKLKVDIRLGVEATPELILAQSPDAIVVATGSKPWLPDVEGTEQPHVSTARAVMAGASEVAGKILVVDTTGRAEAATTADWLSEQGHQVDLLTGLETIAPYMPSPARHHLLEKLMSAGVGLITHTALWSIDKTEIDAYNVVTWQPLTLSGYQHVIFASGGLADSELYKALAEQHESTHLIGDAYQARDIEIAVVDGHRIGREL